MTLWVKDLLLFIIVEIVARKDIPHLYGFPNLNEEYENKKANWKAYHGTPYPGIVGTMFPEYFKVGYYSQ